MGSWSRFVMTTAGGEGRSGREDGIVGTHVGVAFAHRLRRFVRVDRDMGPGPIGLRRPRSLAPSPHPVSSLLLCYTCFALPVYNSPVCFCYSTLRFQAMVEKRERIGCRGQGGESLIRWRMCRTDRPRDAENPGKRVDPCGRGVEKREVGGRWWWWC